jgi:hypothetical protein
MSSSAEALQSTRCAAQPIVASAQAGHHFFGGESGPVVGACCGNFGANPFIVLGLGQLFIGQPLQQIGLALTVALRTNVRQAFGQIDVRIEDASGSEIYNAANRLTTSQASQASQPSWPALSPYQM